MTPGARDLSQLTEVAVTAARKAGTLIASRIGTDLAVTRKDSAAGLASQVLTEVDQQAQEVILDVLAAATEQFHLAILAEESADDHSRFERSCFWCIDPIDGTLQFIEGGPGCAVSIALVSRDGAPLIGVAYDPCADVLYQATVGQGALRNGVPWMICSTGTRLSVVCDRSFFSDPGYEEKLAQLADLAARLGLAGIDHACHGGSVINACRVTELGPACYPKQPRVGNTGGSIWDYAATACMFQELGAPCSDIFGAPLELNRRESTFLNHRGLLYASNASIARQLIQQ